LLPFFTKLDIKWLDLEDFQSNGTDNSFNILFNLYQADTDIELQYLNDLEKIPYKLSPVNLIILTNKIN